MTLKIGTYKTAKGGTAHVMGQFIKKGGSTYHIGALLPGPGEFVVPCMWRDSGKVGWPAGSGEYTEGHHLVIEKPLSDLVTDSDTRVYITRIVKSNLFGGNDLLKIIDRIAPDGDAREILEAARRECESC